MNAERPGWNAPPPTGSPNVQVMPRSAISASTTPFASKKSNSRRPFHALSTVPVSAIPAFGRSCASPSTMRNTLLTSNSAVPRTCR